MPFQEAAVSMLEPTKVRNEMKALQTHFRVGSRSAFNSLLIRTRTSGITLSHVSVRWDSR